ncbi:break repair meiotic recombinase recruitment factor 1 isoform X2 [Ranitomeya variabilis]|uniref:break repair meiotic recombinase recruitment factor 1 isoform X2 n=1 Tax=Ranitomeya variabilis TaxID=490064 RepID=UPI00405729EC
MMMTQETTTESWKPLIRTGKRPEYSRKGLAGGQLSATNPEVSITVVLPTCHQGEHHDGGDVMGEMSTTDYIGPVCAGATDNLSPTATEKTENSVQGPNDTDVTATSITETIDVTGGHHSLVFMDCRRMISNGCESEEASDTGMDQNISAFTEDPNSQVAQNSQPLNATPDLHGLPNTPIIPVIASQLQSGISQSELLVFHGIEGRGGDEGQCRDPEVIMSPEVTCAQQIHRCEVEAIPSQQRDAPEEDPRGATIGLDVLDSQLLGALQESLYEPAKTPRGDDRELPTSQSRTRPPSVNNNTVALFGMEENHIDAHQQETPQAVASLPVLPEEAAPAQGARGDKKQNHGDPPIGHRPQERRTEDASSTVQGLIMELSNINRLIMSTYRDLRQKRVRHPPGRGAMSGKRRREK